MITGASRGIGLEFVSQYNADGWRVFACCRTPGQADELAGIASQSAGRVTLHQLDVDDGASVVALKFELGDQPMDVLLNNAGIIGQRDSGRGGVDYEAWQDCIVTNVFGPMRVSEVFADNVAASKQK